MDQVVAPSEQNNGLQVLPTSKSVTARSATSESAAATQ
jgi:hypothetical protein